MLQMREECFWMHVDLLNLSYMSFDLLDAGHLLPVAVVVVILQALFADSLLLFLYIYI